MIYFLWPTLLRPPHKYLMLLCNLHTSFVKGHIMTCVALRANKTFSSMAAPFSACVICMVLTYREIHHRSH